MTINILSFNNDIIAKSKSTHIRGMDWQDIFQELSLHLWQKRNSFDPSKAGERTFVIRLSDNKIKDLARRANAQKRLADTYAVSLDQLVEDGFDVAELLYE